MVVVVGVLVVLKQLVLLEAGVKSDRHTVVVVEVLVVVVVGVVVVYESHQQDLRVKREQRLTHTVVEVVIVELVV